MAEYRTIRMSFWADPFVEELEAGAKLLYLYLFTGPHTNNLGIVEVTRRKMAFETGLAQIDVEAHLKSLVDAGKILCDGGQILLCNFIRNQTTTSPKIMQSLRKMIPSVQSEVFKKALSVRYPALFAGDDTVSVPHTYPVDTVSIPYAHGMDTVGIPSPEGEREEEREVKENTASATPSAEPALASSPVGGEEKPASTSPEAATMGKGRGTRAKAAPPPQSAPDKLHYRAKSGRCITGKRLEAFEQFWRDFAFAKGKAEAADAWLDIPQLTSVLVEQICHAAQREAAARGEIEAKGQTPKWAQGWISARRWEDYAPEQASGGMRSPPAHTPAYDRELTPEEQAAAKAVRERIVRERQERRGLIPTQGAA